MVARTRLNVTSHVHCMSCLILVSAGQELLIIWQLLGLSHLLRIKRINVWHWGNASRSTTRKTSLIASLLIANPTRTVLWPNQGTPVGDQPPDRWHCVSFTAALIYCCILKGYGGLGGEAAVILSFSRFCRVLWLRAVWYVSSASVTEAAVSFEREADQSLPSSAEVKNVWSCNSVAPYVFYITYSKYEFQASYVTKRKRSSDSQRLSASR